MFFRKKLGKKELASVPFVIVSFLMLLIGNFFYEKRLSIIDGMLSVNQLLTYVLALSMLLSMQYRREILLALIYFMPIFFCSIKLIDTHNWDYGIFKYMNLLLSLMIIAPALSYQIKINGMDYLAKIIVISLLGLLFLSLIYKARYGFFDRNVNFLFNGPIVFARIMGIGLLLSVFFNPLRDKYILPVIFFFAMLWTQSKGPILALIITLLIIYLIGVSFKSKVKQLIPALFLIFLVYFNFDYLTEVEQFARYINTVSALQGNVDGDNYGSFGSRIDSFSVTMELILKYPLGVGIGSWSVYLPYIGLDYPHNFILEVFSELGLLFGVLFLLPSLCYLLFNKSIFTYIWVFLIINQMYSGDLLDARYLLIFAFLAFRFRKVTF